MPTHTSVGINAPRGTPFSGNLSREPCLIEEPLGRSCSPGKVVAMRGGGRTYLTRFARSTLLHFTSDIWLEGCETDGGLRDVLQSRISNSGPWKVFELK